MAGEDLELAAVEVAQALGELGLLAIVLEYMIATPARRDELRRAVAPRIEAARELEHLAGRLELRSRQLRRAGSVVEEMQLRAWRAEARGAEVIDPTTLKLATPAVRKHRRRLTTG